MAPKYATALANSTLGRRVLRRLLRTEVGEVDGHLLLLLGFSHPPSDVGCSRHRRPPWPDRAPPPPRRACLPLFAGEQQAGMG
jgi:hypothetical protein